MREYSMAPRILNLGIRWSWVVSFTSPRLYSPGESTLYHLDRRLGGSQRRSVRGGEKIPSLPLPGNRTPVVPPVA